MKHFVYKSLHELAQAARTEGALHVNFEPDTERVRAALARKVRVGDILVGNSIAIHPMEGCDGTLDGRPGELTWRRYERFARGGAKLLWFEATAVRADGRANTRQLWIHRRNVSDFARLLEMTRRVHRETYGNADDLLEPLQLTHSGRHSVPTPVVAYHNPFVDEKTRIPPEYPVISDEELERLEDDYVEAAQLALQAGFRAVEIKVTHGYLLSELMSARLREGRYGGSLENRCRFVRNVIGKIRAAVGNRLLLVMRLGCYDGIPYARDPKTGLGIPFKVPIPYPHGFGVDPNDPLREDLTEVKQAVAWFKDWGIALLNVSMGSPYLNPHIGRPFEKPDEGNYEQPEHPLLGVDRHFRIAGALQRTFPDLPMVGTGYSWLQKFAIHAAAHNILAGNIRFFGVGRNALAYPDFARDALEKGELDEQRVCKTVTFCTYLMRRKEHPLGQFPTGCVPFDKEVYGPLMKEAREAARAKVSAALK
jgi:2,4-dienoyl-CoA reductase-like NADH-dependent reductase (Old Yellow Enzyme family)